MNILRATPRLRFPIAIGAGLLLAASFPRWGVAGFAWVAPGLMVAAALGTRGGESFRVGYAAALTHYLVSLHWLLLIPYRWHGVPLGPAAGWLSLSAFLALFPALWVWWLVSSRPPAAKVEGTPAEAQNVHPRLGPEDSDSLTPIEALDAVPPTTWMRRSLWALGGAALWVTFEMVFARVFGGFPWDLLGVSQYRMTPLIQIASVTGVYGVSFLVVWLSLSLVSAGVMILRRPASRLVWVAEVFLPLLAVAILFNLGMRRLSHAPESTRAVKLALVQPSIPQTLIWDESKDDERFRELVRLSEEAMTNHPDLLLWPEAAVPKLLRYYDDTFYAVTNLAGKNHAWMIIGADDMEPRPGTTRADDNLFFNSSFLVSDKGKLMERYLKRNLVMFGEYLPLEGWLPFLKWFTPIQGGFTAGKTAGHFAMADLGVKASVLICFEDIFPQLGPKSVEPDTDFLVNLTNDGWFGEGAAQWQQAATALFRAVENGLPLVRCTNTGLTCWVDAQGRLRDIFRDAQGSVYGAGFLLTEIPIHAPGELRSTTFYNRHGDWFGWNCVVLCGLAVARRFVLRGKLAV